MVFAQSQRFLVGTVISQTFAAFFTRIIPFGVMALIGFIPTIIFLVGYFYFAMKVPGFMEFPVPGEAADTLDPDALTDLPWIWMAIGFVVLFAASIATSAIWLAATSYGTFQYLRGQPVRIWECLQRGVAVVLPCIGFMFIIGIGALIAASLAVAPAFLFIDDYESTEGVLGLVLWMFLAGIVLFIVFAVIGLRLWVTVPAIAVENPGVFAAMSRSWDLSRGNAWRLFGIVLVMWAGSLAASFVAGIVIVLFMAFGGVAGILIGQGVNILVSIVTNALFAIAGAVAYVELRRAQEGFGIEDIAAVFD